MGYHTFHCQQYLGLQTIWWTVQTLDTMVCRSTCWLLDSFSSLVLKENFSTLVREATVFSCFLFGFPSLLVLQWLLTAAIPMVLSFKDPDLQILHEKRILSFPTFTMMQHQGIDHNLPSLCDNMSVWVHSFLLQTWGCLKWEIELKLQIEERGVQF